MSGNGNTAIATDEAKPVLDCGSRVVYGRVGTLLHPADEAVESSNDGRVDFRKRRRSREGSITRRKGKGRA